MPSIRSLRESARHGLLTQRLLERLTRVGLTINPYYLFEEGAGASLPSAELADAFSSGVLVPGDLPEVEANSWASLSQLQERMDKGHLCILSRHEGRVVGYTWADPHEVNDEACDFALGPGDVYLYDMFVKPEHRGRGLAPYLRAQCYEHLRRAGFERFYSISDYFNTPAVRFKRKLGAQPKRLYVQVKIRGREVGQWSRAVRS